MQRSALRISFTYGHGPVPRLVVLGMLAAIAFLGCTGPESPVATLTPTSPPQPATPPAQMATPVPAATLPSTEVPRLTGSPAPDFAFSLFQGKEELGGGVDRLAHLRGRPIVLNFWARFCGPCWTEMPELQHFYEAYGDRLQLLGIDLGQFTGLGSPKDAGKLLEALGITYPAGFTDDAHVVRSYQVAAMPTTVFIDSEGIVFQTWTGSINRGQLEAIVTSMLAQE